jgi:glycerol-3-phosphate dehydrogenase
MKLDRAKNLERMRRESFDIIVIGGGITGAGVARDAASRGLKVALIEGNDFASGTSSRSSKLIHGGIRYLENLEFGLVFEALRERRNLFDMAPHLVHPLRFVLPLYADSRVGMFKMGLGMFLYDALSMFEAPELHERLGRDESMARVSMLNSKNLKGSYVYSDAYMDDDRLVIETLRSAHSFGATMASYVRATGAIFNDSKEFLTGVQCHDEVSGDKFQLSARHIVSTVGPWTDDVGQMLLGDWHKVLRPSKGIHLTLRRDRLKLDEAVVMAADDEKRIVFAIPRHEMIIVGTTDTDYSGDPRDVQTHREDVIYLLKILADYFPGANLTENDILASYSGVRPLVHDDAATESKTSREHVIISVPQRVTFVAGGKYTTYRKMAEDTVLKVLETFSLEERVRYGKSKTLEPLNPLVTSDSLLRASLMADDWARMTGVDVDTVNFLAERHGSEAFAILQKNPLLPGTNAKNLRWHLEAQHAIDETMCFHLKDFYLRRVPLFLSRADHGLLLINEIAFLFQSRLGWSEGTKKAEIEAVRQHLQHEMGWRGTLTN